MNAQYLVLILLNGWLFSKLITATVAISQVKPNLLKAGKAHARRLQPSTGKYVYLNYKESYGLRFDPKKIHIKRQSNNPSDDQPSGVPISMPTPPPAVSASTMDSVNEMQTEIVSNITTTVASPSSSDVSITTSSTTTTSTQSTTAEGTRPNKQPVLAFSSLLNWNNAAKRQNATTAIQRPKPSSSSSLKETLQLIRKRLKQWFALGTDTKASLVNGQRFLNVFNVIKFENGPCTSTQEGLAEMSGICYQDFQCTEMGGSAIDECADGLGVCCVCKRIRFKTLEEILEEILLTFFCFYSWKSNSDQQKIKPLFCRSFVRRIFFLTNKQTSKTNSTNERTKE